MFNDIASDYDPLNHLMSMNVDKHWRKKALKQFITDKPQNILDVACGTGDFSIAIAKSMSEGSHLTGVDLSEGMLEVMKKKVEAANLSDKISIETGDCENLRFEDNTFDAVTVAFGVRNFENLEAGLCEIQRVLKPQGKAVILELSTPANPIIAWFYKIYFVHIMPLIGGSISKNKGAYKYLPASVLRFPKKQEFINILSRCGFTAISHKALTFGICRMYVAQKPTKYNL